MFSVDEFYSGNISVRLYQRLFFECSTIITENAPHTRAELGIGRRITTQPGKRSAFSPPEGVANDLPATAPSYLSHFSFPSTVSRARIDEFDIRAVPMYVHWHNAPTKVIGRVKHTIDCSKLRGTSSACAHSTSYLNTHSSSPYSTPLFSKDSFLLLCNTACFSFPRI